MDINDPALQQAVRDNNDLAITKSIEVGIDLSTHLMTLISEKTKNSWWVPYEVGLAKNAGKDISTLELKEAYAPSFLKITRLLKNVQGLDKYIDDIINNQYGHKHSILNESNDYNNHLLADFLRV
jgi:hypothetical protein